MPFFARCTDVTTGAQVTPDGESFDTFDSALESLVDDMDLDAQPLPEVDGATALRAAADESGFEFDLVHLDGVSRYRCAIVRADGTSDAIVRDDEEAESYLAHDSGYVPCSRYGDAVACAAVALVVERIAADANGEPMTFRGLDYTMGLAVNDSPSLAGILADHATDDVLDGLGYDRLDTYRLAGRVDAWTDAAREAGADAARAAATWTTDGNTDSAAAANLLARIEDGDPAACDSLPRTPNLSGEFAGDPTPLSLARDVTGLGLDGASDDSMNWESVLVDELADAFESGVEDVFESACCAALAVAADGRPADIEFVPPSLGMFDRLPNWSNPQIERD